jgi:hypothetical protein
MQKRQYARPLLRRVKYILVRRRRRLGRAKKNTPRGWAALGFLNLAVLLCALESAYVQVATTGRELSFALFSDPSFFMLFGIDLAVPLCVSLLSRRAFMVMIVLQAVLSSILLHYALFFYNPLTLSTLYHSMQGLSALGVGVTAFARWNIILVLGVLCLVKLGLVRMSRIPDREMPPVWDMRGITAVVCMAAVFWMSSTIYAKTGLSLVWVDSRGHRTATERRLENGTREAVRTLGYIATWVGEFLSGTYADLDLIYAEARCKDPGNKDAPGSRTWDGNPLPPLPRTVVMVQVESLDFEAVDMWVKDIPVMPFLSRLSESSLRLEAFAPHKVGSSNSDYELLNSRVADQNVLYYEYITEYPDSAIRMLGAAGYASAVFHGLEGDLFRLRGAYKAMGFEHHFFKEELREQGYKQGRGILKQIPDKDVFSAALSFLRPYEKQALFIITLDSHIPFSDVRAEFSKKSGTFARYISSLRNFDEALADFYFQLPEETLLIIWGDHGSDVSYPGEYPQNRRRAPFIVHAKGDREWMAGTGARQDSRAPYTLCELSFYLKRIFTQAQPEDGESSP